MSGFSDREKDFENKYAHDGEVGFNVEARAGKLFGLWVAEKLGLSGNAAQSYAKEVVTAGLQLPGLDDALHKAAKDLKAKNIALSDRQLKAELDKALEVARQQVTKEGK